MRLKGAVGIQLYSKVPVAFAGEKIVGAAMIDVEHAERAVDNPGVSPEGVLRRVGKRDLHTSAGGLFQLKLDPHMTVNAALEGWSVGGRIGLADKELLVPVQRLFRFLLAAEPQERLAQEKIRRRIIRFELNDL